MLMGILLVALGGAITGFILLGDSWFQLLIAGALGLIFTQFAFLAHEASHRQVFESGPANDRTGRAIAAGVVGISYAWWMTKHTRHHANPNKVGKDPDIDFDTISFTEADAAKQRGIMALITRKQGYLFFPLLTLEGVNLHFTSIRTLFDRKPVKGRAIELSLIAARFAVYFGAIFWMLPLGMAFAFIGVQLAVFGIYMGASFAPNHKGMPIIPADAKLDFFSKQVLTSRNVSGGFWASAALRRPQLPGRAPPLPEHAPPAPREGARDRARARPQPRRALHRDDDHAVVRHRHPVPQPRRPLGPRPVRLPDGEPVPQGLITVSNSNVRTSRTTHFRRRTSPSEPRTT